ncbi:MAG: hypothetical protein ACRDQA_31745, partial [Nocardioidaceae bacterium]
MARFRQIPGWAGEEGPRWRVSVAAGVVAVGAKDLARAERASERQASASMLAVDLEAARYARTMTGLLTLAEGSTCPMDASPAAFEVVSYLADADPVPLGLVQAEIEAGSETVAAAVGWLAREGVVIEQGPWQPGEWTPRPSPSRQIAGWSRKSRANMVRVLAELDY